MLLCFGGWKLTIVEQVLFYEVLFHIKWVIPLRNSIRRILAELVTERKEWGRILGRGLTEGQVILQEDIFTVTDDGNNPFLVMTCKAIAAD